MVPETLESLAQVAHLPLVSTLPASFRLFPISAWGDYLGWADYLAGPLVSGFVCFFYDSWRPSIVQEVQGARGVSLRINLAGGLGERTKRRIKCH